MNSIRLLWFITLMVISIQSAFAGVIVGGTRVVYSGEKREASISVKNPEKANPYLIQSWIENIADGMADAKKKAPFIITPPLFRLDAGQENILRIVHAGEALPKDRESVFWLNIKSIPSLEKDAQNQLIIAVKTRIKLFFRPAGLMGKVEDAFEKLKFEQVGTSLQATNPTPYYISFQSLNVDGKKIEGASMIAPFSTSNWPLESQNVHHVTWKAINDYGGATQQAQASL